MIALIPVCSTDDVVVGALYLARISNENFTIVHPVSTDVYSDSNEQHYRLCKYIGDDNKIYRWDEIRELARIIWSL